MIRSGDNPARNIYNQQEQRYRRENNFGFPAVYKLMIYNGIHFSIYEITGRSPI
jgi:hypothetical protein